MGRCLLMERLREMPGFLRAMTLLAFLAPLVSVLSFFSDRHTGDLVLSTESGLGGYEVLIFRFVFSIPMFLSAIFIMRKKPRARSLFLMGWLLLCLCPLLPISLGMSWNIFELIFSAFVGLAIWFFMTFNEKMAFYFDN